MNFFTHQDRARSSTRKLVLLFACAVLVLIVMASLLIYGVLFYAQGQSAAPGEGVNLDLLTSDIFVKVSLGVITVVVLGSLFRLGQLRGGGKVVAESMKGRLLNTSTRDADERKVLNVVEEMAIAAGLPVPPVYLMEDAGINAFAAGYHQKDAVIGVTRGCIQQLDRDELQGVIAHEFSHIFNGDMRLNIRLIGILYGIMVIGLIGYYMMRSSMYSGRRKNGGGLVIAGLGLVVIGYGGTFFGNLIKAAVSRQREFLADASAVQFTRNPYGISGALKKIGGYPEGSQIRSVDSSEISHMLFEEGGSSFSSLFATHPPLGDRIRRIQPGWQGDYNESTPAGAVSTPGMAGFAGGGGGETAVDNIGNPGPEHVAQAGRTMAQIPASLMADAHDTLGAASLMFALVMDSEDRELSHRQKNILSASLSRQEMSEFTRIQQQVFSLDRALYLPLVDIALPNLKQFSKVQYRNFMSTLSQLIVADKNVTLFEWSLFMILRYNLDPVADKPRKAIDLGHMKEPCDVLLSALAVAGNEDQVQQQEAFNSAAGYLRDKVRLGFRPGATDVTKLDEALDTLRLMKPLQKPMFLKAMAVCITADGRVTPVEGELLRAVGSLLDCPVPPLLDNQRFV